jgi:hypothetical protein
MQAAGGLVELAVAVGVPRVPERDQHRSDDVIPCIRYRDAPGPHLCEPERLGPRLLLERSAVRHCHTDDPIGHRDAVVGTGVVRRVGERRLELRAAGNERPRERLDLLGLHEVVDRVGAQHDEVHLAVSPRGEAQEQLVVGAPILHGDTHAGALGKAIDASL